MFIISMTYLVPLREVEKHLAAHLLFLDKYYESGLFLISGRKQPRTGGIIIANTTQTIEIEEALKDDPFQQHKLATYEVTEFIPSKTTHKLNFLQQIP
ncbi:YciI family protein [Pseudoalteromonas sp. MMG005]|uniref:YciI family protein n=1 Tax=Pseudoalteromonas sp. MMG005 TaxID=2822682 RepID=UPI001B3A6113|nr:YciI family protein [Pseudoalteromonas sp. MMG005]MBQ4845363.1 hypothetical protein [Pseudoalteromonas sp. MMG005]